MSVLYCADPADPCADGLYESCFLYCVRKNRPPPFLSMLKYLQN